LGCCQPGTCRCSCCCFRYHADCLRNLKAFPRTDHPYGAVCHPWRTLPSITATHEFVVPRSIPMTSSALRALDTLQTQPSTSYSMQMG
jgi:hypothetical protein